jgi:alcohol dehydrogenase class IV
MTRASARRWSPLVEPAFNWNDGERVIRFGRGIAAEATRLVQRPYALLSTPRALASAPPGLKEGAAETHLVALGLVDEVAAALRGSVLAPTLVAIGGGRVIDVAKALAAADPPRRVVAIPTTLSGAEMTAIHRHATGVPAEAPKVRPALVLADPALSASQPEAELAASAANALGHAVEAPLTPRASPVPTLAAFEAARLIAGAFTETADRDALALAALLAGYAIDGAGYGLHHVMSQTLVRHAGVDHGPANAVMLPHCIRVLRRRFPDVFVRLQAHVGADPSAVATALAERAGATSLAELGVARETLADLAARAAERAELAMTPPAATAAELESVYSAAWERKTLHTR